MNVMKYLPKVLLIAGILIFMSSLLSAQQYTRGADWDEHEGTWLAWPHDSTYGPGNRAFFESAWVEMTRELVKSENVHIVSYSQAEVDHTVELLTASGIALDKIDFFIHPTDDYWIRDNGPIFVKDEQGNLVIGDWKFDGWGNDWPYLLDDQIPSLIGADIDKTVLDLSAMVLEGGAIEVDGNGTLLATKSSITGDHRNDGLTLSQVEDYLTTYLGVSNIVWLEGKYGGSFDVTDSHIDGFAKFLDTSTIVTMNSTDLAYWFVSSADRNILYNMTNANGNQYNYVYLPLTKKVVKTTDGVSTGSKGSYVNYYEGNTVVLVPTYADDNDDDAIAIIQGLYPAKEVVGIDCRNMFSVGGMVHCVTQQQPMAVASCSLVASTNPTGTVTACKGTDVILTCEDTGVGITYQWRKDGNAVSGATSKTYTNSKEEAGFDVVVSLGDNCSSISPVVYIDRLSKPAASITPQGNLDICNIGSVDLQANAGSNFQYQWKKNSANISGATNQLYTATVTGNYKVVVTNKKGCSKTSKETVVTSSCRTGTTKALAEFAVYPNPAADFITVAVPFETGMLSISNSVGVIVMEQTVSKQLQQFDVSNLVPGLYVIRIVSGDLIQTRRLVKE
ncbi:MAG: agmatine deiminase family protein [Chitinophagales bacterium]|nr:agmatine deiminase family protein [Chitinophagales bacterium]